MEPHGFPTVGGVAASDDRADSRVEPRAVAAAGQHADASRHHASSSGILRAGAVPGRYASVVLAAWSPLQWTFAIALGVILGTSGLIVLFLVARLFVNPARRGRRTSVWYRGPSCGRCSSG